MTPKRLALPLVAFAAALALLPATAGPARAQQATPYTAYGVGLVAGQTVVAYVGSVSCGSATADAKGQWLLSIAADAACHPQAGDTLTFTLDGKATTASETWKAGGAPTDVTNGITLTLKAPAAGAGTFASMPAAHGVSPVLWNGGSIDQMVAAAGAGLQSIWVYNAGGAVGYTSGAPSFVNAAFLALFPGNEVPAGQIVILVLG